MTFCVDLKRFVTILIPDSVYKPDDAELSIVVKSWIIHNTIGYQEDKDPLLPAVQTFLSAGRTGSRFGHPIAAV